MAIALNIILGILLILSGITIYKIASNFIDYQLDTEKTLLKISEIQDAQTIKKVYPCILFVRSLWGQEEEKQIYDFSRYYTDGIIGVISYSTITESEMIEKKLQTIPPQDLAFAQNFYIPEYRVIEKCFVCEKKDGGFICVFD